MKIPQFSGYGYVAQRQDQRGEDRFLQELGEHLSFTRVERFADTGGRDEIQIGYATQTGDLLVYADTREAVDQVELAVRKFTASTGEYVSEDEEMVWSEEDNSLQDVELDCYRRRILNALEEKGLDLNGMFDRARELGDKLFDE